MSEELPEGWARTRLDAIATAIQYGYTASAEHGRQGPRLLRITDIQDGRVDWATVPGCKIDSSDLNKYQVVAGDIVFARSGATTGKSFLIKEAPPEAVFASYLIRVRANRQLVEPAYLARFFQSPAYWEYISDNVAGNAQPNCNGSKLAALDLPLPPLAEQRRIVAKVEALLARVNAARERLEKVPPLLKRFRQAVLAKAFSGELVPTEADLAAREGRAFQSAAQLLGIPEPKSSGDLPEGWVETQLGDLIDGFQAGRNLSAQGRPAGPSEFGVLKISAVTWGSFRPEQNKALLVGDQPKPHELVARGDLLITRANTSDLVGAVVLVGEHYPRLMLPDKILRLLPLPRVVDSRYLLHSLRSAQAREHFAANATGTSESMRNLSQPKLAATPVRLAPLREQRRIAAQVEALLGLADSLERVVGRVRESIAKVPQTILQRAFAGELVPTEAELATIEGRTFESAVDLLRRATNVAAGSAVYPPAPRRQPRRPSASTGSV